MVKGNLEAYHQAEILNLQGMVLQQLPLIAAQQLRFSTADLDKGTYLLQLQRTDGTHTTLKFCR